jgi:hypothetical protein
LEYKTSDYYYPLNITPSIVDYLILITTGCILH